MESVKSFIAGYIGGFGLVAVGQPFDTIKTRIQANPDLYKSAFDCTKQTIGKEGFMTLYRGGMAVAMSLGPAFAVYFAAYDSCELALRKLCDLDPKKQLPTPHILACSGFTGIVGSLIYGPAELIKVRQQTAFAKKMDSSAGAVIRAIVKEKGALGIFTGTGSTMVRDVPGSMAWFGGYELAKALMCKDPQKPTTTEALVAGGIGGIANWLVVLPLDGVKTYIQASTTKVGWFTAFRAVGANGPRGFYRGIGPVLLRAFPANAACFAFKVKALETMNKYF
eukprot:NODE_1027_length_1039_cov_1182.646465_g851_i0.p1 GENE.NODE_1027_length_1039_cov_1182.646465_g851_i0~~NODE_1027_length_1039_cov_1182.646465_g851_i0.p1  ORF type:complete len:280 (+),score=68.44 NODE_1027_length_1039_cov_1182.646465_g851_i0:115-954(+)